MAQFYINNSFSVNMLERKGQTLKFVPITVQAAKNLMSNHNVSSIVGHADAANIISDILETNVEFNRVNVSFDGNWSLIVAQYTGPRLPEGTTELPEGAKIEFWQVYPE